MIDAEAIAIERRRAWDQFAAQALEAYITMYGAQAQANPQAQAVNAAAAADQMLAERDRRFRPGA